MAGTEDRWIGADIDTLDMDGDGDLDTVIAEPNTDGESIWRAPGAVHLFADLPDPVGVLTTDDAHAHLTDDRPDGFAIRLETGDVDGDGYDDLITHTPSVTGGLTLDGSVEVFTGPFDADATRDEAWASGSVDLPGGIGLGDAALFTVHDDTFVALGAPLYGGDAPSGRVYIIDPAPGAWTADGAVARLESEFPTSMGGHLLVADLDEDGLDDLIALGSPYHDEGAIHIFLGGIP